MFLESSIFYLRRGSSDKKVDNFSAKAITVSLYSSLIVGRYHNRVCNNYYSIPNSHKKTFSHKIFFYYSEFLI